MERVNLVTADFKNAFESHKETLKRSASTVRDFCHIAHKAYMDLVESSAYEDLHPAERLDYVFRQIGLTSLDRCEIADYFYTVDKYLSIQSIRRGQSCATPYDLAAALLSMLLSLNVQLPANYWLGLVFLLYSREPNPKRYY